MVEKLAKEHYFQVEKLKERKRKVEREVSLKQ